MTAMMRVGDWLLGGLDLEHRRAEIVPFAHGYESRRPFHCWAIVQSADDGRICARIANLDLCWRVGVKVCTQHYEQIVRSGLHVIRPSRAQLEQMLRDLDREAEEERAARVSSGGTS